jgi:hypothetical protein
MEELWKRDIMTLLDDPQRHELVYHIAGQRDINLVRQFQQEVLAHLATIKTEPSVHRYDGVVNTSDGSSDHYVVISPHTHMEQSRVRKLGICLCSLDNTL